MSNNKLTWARLAAGIFASGIVASNLQGQTPDPALNALIKKGILTEQEAKAALAEQEAKAKAAGKSTGNNVQVSWKDGLSFQSADGKFKGKLGGRLQWDVAGFSEGKDVRSIPGIGDIPAGTEFRRARLSLEGDVGTSMPVFFKVEFDFAPAEIQFKDVFVGVDKIPVVGRFQVGHFKEPMGLEILTSSRFLTFLERSTPMEAFLPERNIGAMVSNTLLEERMTWAAGVFTDTDDLGRTSGIDGNYRVTGRLSGLPWYDEEAKGARLLHVGVSGSYVDPKDDTVRFRSRPEAHLAPRFVDTGSTAITGADHTLLAGAEAAVVFESFSLQAEYDRSWVSASTFSPSFDGFYVFGTWFITGEHRNYKRSTGTFDRVIPNKNFSLTDPGLGAWELAARYSQVNLNDEGITGGRLNDITGGVNWYLNPNAKIQFNYVNAKVDRSGIDGTAHIFETRFAVDF